jgi:hypothetical protein
MSPLAQGRGSKPLEGARAALEASLEEEKGELLEKPEQAADEARIGEELAACDRLLKRIREMPAPA